MNEAGVGSAMPLTIALTLNLSVLPSERREALM
jgi:hypothetical protein